MKISKEVRRTLAVYSVAIAVLLAFIGIVIALDRFPPSSPEFSATEVRQAVDRYMAGEYVSAEEFPWLDTATFRPNRTHVNHAFKKSEITAEERDAFMQWHEVYWRKPGEQTTTGDQ